jgi:glycosyltransferase involved in cell wall biosynthesis
MVTKFLPLPDNSGGRQRSLAIARRLAERGQLTLCAFDDGFADHDGLAALGIDVRSVPWSVSPSSTAKGIVATHSVTAGRFWNPALATLVRAAAAEGPLDLLQVEYQQMVPYVSGIPARCRVLDLHNVESSLVASYAKARRGPSSVLYRAESVALRRMERRTLRAFDQVVVVSEKERSRLPMSPPSVLLCPNGREPAGVLPAADHPTVAFVATMGWAPNVDAAVWLGREIWPLILRQVPDARLLLVGKDPAPEVQALGNDQIEVTGTVSEVAPYLQRARVVVAPLLAGGGTRLKIMEALDTGRPVVATSVGCDGLEDLIGTGVVIANSAPDIANEVSRLLGDPSGTAELGARGHDAVHARHSWDAALAPLLEAVPE